MHEKMKVKSLSGFQLFVTKWTVAYQASPSMGFSRKEYWSGLPLPSPGDLPDPGIALRSPALRADALPSEPPGKPQYTYYTAAKSLQSCPTLCDPIVGSPPGSPVPGILQARTLEWVAISFSNACKWKVKVKSLSCVRLSATPWTAAYQAPPSVGFSRQEYWSGLPLPSLNTPLIPTHYSLQADFRVPLKSLKIKAQPSTDILLKKKKAKLDFWNYRLNILCTLKIYVAYIYNSPGISLYVLLTCILLFLFSPHVWQRDGVCCIKSQIKRNEQ